MNRARLSIATLRLGSRTAVGTTQPAGVLRAALLLAALAWLFQAPAAENHGDARPGIRAEHDDHAGHDHAEGGEDVGHDQETEAAEHDDHAGHDHETEAGEQDDHAGHAHGNEGLSLSDAERRNMDLVLGEAGPGDLKTAIRMPGEVTLNEDRVTHVVPLVSGIARRVDFTVGDTVGEGDVLAVLDSSDLGEAKLDYLTKVNELAFCSLLVPRAQAVHDNALRLISFLDRSPSLEDLRSFEAGETGEHLGALVSAYAESVLTTQTFSREKALFEKSIGSQQEYHEAKSKNEKAMAEYLAARDSIAFAVRHDLAETLGARRAAEFEANTAKRRLVLMGVEENEIRLLDALVLPESQCTDPNCSGCPAGAAADDRARFFAERLSRYEVRSPAAGVIVAKHLARGERVNEDSDIATVADLTTVWVNLTVHLRDLPSIAVGQPVAIQAEHSGRLARGVVATLSPLVDQETRTASARVLLDNEDGTWRPGLFVTGHIDTSAQRLPVVIPKSAVQVVDGNTVVFVPGGAGFVPTRVRTGRSDRERVEITAGLVAGTAYVTEGAFALKAKLVTSTLDSHAGHGH
ncbi:MAG: efflux RND transporter periplasmic adaptor subunit [Lentisphaeria bacterium]|nr:efflux RND transporter periplasmic adaptor subunit [Lentisphaeria bacterium]